MFKIMKTYDGSISSNINNVGATVKDIINSVKAAYGPLDEDTLFELTVVLNEILLNAVKHGNKQDETKQVKIAAGIDKSGFACFIVEDEGCGYDYDSLCSRKTGCDEGDDICSIMESGRGIMIVKNLCDKVRVNSKGNKIVVMKKLG